MFSFGGHVWIDGVEYQADVAGIQRQPEQVNRQQFDTGGERGASALSSVTWQRSQRDWRNGGGQRWFDDRVAVGDRFWESESIIGTEAHEVMLAAALTESLDSTHDPNGTALSFLISHEGSLDNRVFLTAGENVWYSDNWGDTWSSKGTWLSGGRNGTPIVINNTLIVPDRLVGTSRKTTWTGTPSWSDWGGTPAVGYLQYDGGRILGFGTTRTVHELDNAGAQVSGSLNHTYPSTSCSARPGCAGPGGIYIIYREGRRSEIHLVTVNSDGSLAAPVFAAGLPFGELLYAIAAVGNVVITGSNFGIRVGVFNADGSISFGNLIETAGAGVLAFAAYSRYVWATDFSDDTDEYFVYRLDLNRFVDNAQLTPASWLEHVGVEGHRPYGLAVNESTGEILVASTQGDITTSSNEIHVYKALASDAVADTGWFSTGVIDMGLSLAKRWLSVTVDIKGLVVDGAVQVQYRLKDSAAWTTLGTLDADTETTKTLEFASISGKQIELRFNFTEGTSPGPVMTGWSIEAIPVPGFRSETIAIPVLVGEQVVRGDGVIEARSTAADRERLWDLMQSRSIVDVSIGSRDTTNGGETRKGYIDIANDRDSFHRWGYNEDVPQGAYLVLVQTVS